MALLRSASLYLLASCAPFLNAYHIDSSCDSTSELITDAATEAFSMAADALAAIETEDRDSNVDRLLRLLFGEDAPTGDLTKITDSFRGIGDMSTSTNDAGNERREVKIFCSMDRLSKRDDGALYDSSIQQIVSDEGEKATLDDCGATDFTLAYTTIPRYLSSRNDAGGYDTTFFPSQVTFCPWFIRWAASQRYKTWKDLDAKSLGATVVIPLVTKGWPFTPIDAVSLLDKVMLHELTHTYAGGDLDDVEMESGGVPGWGVAYGWNAVTNLAKQAPSDVEQSSLNNADSLALFASGVRLLGQDEAIYIADNGKAQTSNPLSSSKRGLPRALQYRSTPAAFEGFLTVIKERQAAATAGIMLAS